ncbi:MAG: helix-turn-helix domain-containing protein [Desulfobacterales bacterium]|nr:helix-turn-helix domain-containing protein [Desulfobacterales bacterium]
MRHIAILAFENTMQSSITGPFDIFSVASLEWRKQYPESEDSLFSPKIVTDGGKPATCFNGAVITPHMAAQELHPVDIIFIPVIYGDVAPVLENGRCLDWLTCRADQGAMVCAVCAGVFLVAAAGLLDGRIATTHWALADDFSSRFPDVTLKKEKMIVDEGDVITAGGVTAYMDLALHLTARFGSPEFAAFLSKILLIDPARRSQAPYTAFDMNTAHGDRSILKAQDWMARNLTARVDVAALSGISGLTERTFARRFRRATGDTPMEYLQQLRIGRARTLLETTGDPVDTITWAVGYEDVSSFRRLFKRMTGMSPTAYRRKFSLCE